MVNLKAKDSEANAATGADEDTTWTQILEIQQTNDAAGKTSHPFKRLNIAEIPPTSKCENGKHSDNGVEQGRAVSWRELR